MRIIDRRRNPQGKSLANRQRLMRRAKRQVAEAVRQASSDRSIRDMPGEEKIVIPADSLHEPRLRHDPRTGRQDGVLPGNKHFRQGDRVRRPPEGGGSGGREGSPDGEGEDAFTFVLSREEFLDIFLEDLELPDLMKKSVTRSEQVSFQRAGFTASGAPTNINLLRTMRNSLSRRIALRRPGRAEMAELEREIEAREARMADRSEAENDPELVALRARLERLRRRTREIPFLDPLDLRFNRFEAVPKPVTQAVMFCLMDVSGSMSEDMKDLAKRFFTLLYLFIQRRYRHVEIVFIRHTHRAEEVDEETFFYSRETGGTLVSTALEEMRRVIEARYSPADWNIYAAQASDGDNMTADGPQVAALLENDILPITQYYAYIEVAGGVGELLRTRSNLWQTYAPFSESHANFAARRVAKRSDIYPVFRELFTPETERA
ncbi:YeaH/YhbH family protein [Aquibaculum sediminis]|uniref:YeaH/YhbH family protein n=1 Tax=Aquibaculum sediminis TaxID=3231907 RepID=UPI003456A552